MNRRKFFSLSAAASGFLSVSNLNADGQQAEAHRQLPPLKAKLGHHLNDFTNKSLSYAARFGVELVGGVIPKYDTKQMPSADQLQAIRDLVQKHGLQLEWAECPFMHASNIDSDPFPAIKLGQSPQRDRDIESFQTLIKNCAAAGIPTIQYLFSILGVVRTGTVPGRGNSLDSQMRYDDAKKQTLPLTKAGTINADTYWEYIDYFLSRVVPVANEYKINLACHPNDPGMYSGYRGINRVLGTVDGLKQFIAMYESPYHGISFCQGTISENMDDPNAHIADAILYFGRRKKIFNVHFRNIRGHRGDFAEVFPDEGSVDFVKALRAYREAGYERALIPDHVPAVPGDPNSRDVNFAFELGYIRGMLQAEQHVV